MWSDTDKEQSIPDNLKHNKLPYKILLFYRYYIKSIVNADLEYTYVGNNSFYALHISWRIL